MVWLTDIENDGISVKTEEKSAEETFVFICLQYHEEGWPL